MTTSAPGKLMLFGEHAVVYGYPCIVTAISERLFVSPDSGIVAKDTRFIDAAVNAWGKPGMKLSARCAFSGTYGFGSSSAVSVAALKFLWPDADNKTVFDTAYKIILDIQGTGSGFDVAAAVYGGTLYYIKNKVIEPLGVHDIPLVVGYTGVKSNTVEMVNAVSKKRGQYPEKVGRIFQGITKIVEEAKAKMLEGDWERVGKLMDFNQEYLRDLGVSSEKLETLISAAKEAGAWGAKLSGAGGGDCMIALVSPDKRKAVEDAITNAGGEVIHVLANAPGVRMETTDNQDELFIVVDKDDKILGYKTRFECHHDPSLIHRTVGVLIFNDKGQLLLQKRSETKDMDAGLWAISTTGHVIKGQSYEDAAHRELQEELGVDATLTPVAKFLSETKNETEMAMLYKAVSEGPFIFDKDETSEIKFFDISAIRLMQLSVSSVQSLQEAGVL
jgi:mevalonate kinase